MADTDNVVFTLFREMYPYSNIVDIIKKEYNSQEEIQKAKKEIKNIRSKYKWTKHDLEEYKRKMIKLVLQNGYEKEDLDIFCEIFAPYEGDKKMGTIKTNIKVRI